MLELNLIPRHGNAAAFFPTTGYFGVTPVVLAGSVQTRVPPDGGRPIQVRSVELRVRCYEVQEGGPLKSSRETILWEKCRLLWRPPPGVDEVEIGEWQHPFKITIPPEAAEFAASAQSLREWRVKWRLEAVIEHKPLPHAGHCLARAYPLAIHDHRTPLLPSPPSPRGITLGNGPTTSTVHITTPAGAYGPEDSLPISVSTRLEDPSTTLRKVSVSLERRLAFVYDKTPPSPTSRGSSPTPDGSANHRSKLSTLLRGVSPRARAPGDDAERLISARIVEDLCDAPDVESNGTCRSRHVLQLPRRGAYRWDIGQTQRTPHVDVSYHLRVRVTLKLRKGGDKELVFDHIPITVLGTTTSERNMALQATEQAADAKTRATKRMRKGMYLCSTVNIGVASEPKSILKQDGHGATPSSIRFASPVPAPGDSLVSVLSDDEDDGDNSNHAPSTPSSIASSGAPQLDCATPAPSCSAESTASYNIMSPLAHDDPAIRIVGHTSGRRVSTTTSEEENEQPVRSRPKLSPTTELTGPLFDPHHHARVRPHPHAASRSTLQLPSIDALGLGPLRQPADRCQRRPRTAPTFSTPHAPPLQHPQQRPRSSGTSSFAFRMPALPTRRVDK